MHQAERGRLLARVTDEGGKSNKRDRIPREASRPGIDKWTGRFSNCPDHLEMPGESPAPGGQPQLVLVVI